MVDEIIGACRCVWLFVKFDEELTRLWQSNATLDDLLVNYCQPIRYIFVNFFVQHVLLSDNGEIFMLRLEIPLAFRVGAR
jgi:hypothetical protein